ncbi:MAG: hypothetical protein WC564_05145 [Patescibacteria group bacterium]
MVTAQKIFDLLFSYEKQSSLVNKKVLYQTTLEAVDRGQIDFFIFSCLATKRDREELIVNFFKTLFFDGGTKIISRKFKKVVQITQELESLGMVVNIFPILSDTEPKRTWGWKLPQDELSIACEIMVEQSQNSDLIPKNWCPKLWSEIELGYDNDWNFFCNILNWVRSNGKHQFRVREQIRCLAKFSDRYYFPLGLEETAIRQVASYAFEGMVFQDKFPGAILLQSEYPPSEKDVLYNLLRNQKRPLTILHPFND